MDTIRLGLSIRALRRHRRLRQEDLAAASDSSQPAICRLERGGSGSLSLDAIDRVVTALGARLEVRVLWQGEQLDRLLDADHAALVEQVLGWLQGAGWEARPEVTFNVRGERGSVDVVARRLDRAAVLVVEVKSVVPDAQAVQAGLDRKARLAPEIARSLEWEASVVGRLLVVADSRTARRRVAALGATFGASFPDRGRIIWAWLRDPSRPLRGLLFVPASRQADARQRERIRRDGGAGGTSVNVSPICGRARSHV